MTLFASFSLSFLPVVCRIPDSIGREIEKKCQSIYPLKDVCVRKVKILKKPKFDSECPVCSYCVFGDVLQPGHQRVCSPIQCACTYVPSYVGCPPSVCMVGAPTNVQVNSVQSTTAFIYHTFCM